MDIKIKEITLQPTNNKRLISLCGPYDDNLKELESQLGIIINRNNNFFKLIGTSQSVNIAVSTLTSLYLETESKNGMIQDIQPKQIYLTIESIKTQKKKCKFIKNFTNTIIKITTNGEIIKPRTLNQSTYINNIFNYNITFGIGPAGTGKTYLSIAAAISLLEKKKINA